MTKCGLILRGRGQEAGLLSRGQEAGLLSRGWIAHCHPTSPTAYLSLAVSLSGWHPPQGQRCTCALDTSTTPHYSPCHPTACASWTSRVTAPSWPPARAASTSTPHYSPCPQHLVTHLVLNTSLLTLSTHACVRVQGAGQGYEDDPEGWGRGPG